MTHATTHAPSAGAETPHSAIDWQLIYRSCPLRSAAISGRAKPASPPQKPDGLAQMQIKREQLAAKAQHARNRSRISEASLTEAELYAVTHAALRLEMESKRAREHNQKAFEKLSGAGK